MQMDLAVAALACDQTRISTFQWSYSESERLFQFLNVSGNHHAISHDFSQSGTNHDAYNKPRPPLSAERSQDNRGTFILAGQGGLGRGGLGALLYWRGTSRVDSSTGRSFTLSD